MKQDPSSHESGCKRASECWTLFSVLGPPPPPSPEQLRRGWEPDYMAPGAYMISIGRSLDRFKRGSDARLSFLKARHVEFSYGARTV